MTKDMPDRARLSIAPEEEVVAALIVALVVAVRSGAISIRQAERWLFRPGTMERLERAGLSPEIIDLIHDGTEIDDVADLVPDHLTSALNGLESGALRIIARGAGLQDSDVTWVRDGE